MRRNRDHEAGVVAVLAALMIVMLGAFFAMAFNVGLILDAKNQLQNGADSAALAAARSLTASSTAIAGARVVAEQFSNRHKVMNEQILIDGDSDDVQFGRWHWSLGACAFPDSVATSNAGGVRQCGPGFERTFAPSTYAFKVTAVQVTNGRDGADGHNTKIPTVFSGAFLSTQETAITTKAIAIGPGASTDCSLPMVLPECFLHTANTASNPLRCGETIEAEFTSDPEDGVGFINLSGQGGAPNTNYIINTILGACGGPYLTAEYDLGNGNNFTEAVAKALLGRDHKGDPVSGATCRMGTSQTFAVADNGCPDPKFANDASVVRFISTTLMWVTDQNGNKYDSASCATGTHSSTTNPKLMRRIAFRLDCDDDDGIDYDASAIKLRLVK